MGNPILDQFQELLMLDTGNVLVNLWLRLSVQLGSWGNISSKATTNLSLLTVLALSMSQSKRNSLSVYKCPKPKSKSRQSKAEENLKNYVTFPMTVHCSKKRIAI